MIAIARILGAATLAAVIAAPAAQADAVADFYKGKQITVIVGYGPGGGYDTYTRLLLRHMPRHVPGNPTMVVQNMPGAGSLRAANFVANAAPKDGTTLVVMGAPASLEPLFGNKEAKFETLKLNWIGNMIRDTAACGTWYNSGIKSLDQIIKSKTPVVFGSSGQGSYSNHHALVLKHMLGANLRVISGFKGIKDMGLALQRGELQAQCALALSTAKAAFDGNVKRGELKFLVQFGKKDVPYFGGAPNFYRMLKTDEQRQTADMFFALSEIARPLVGPPGMPPAIVAALRKAMADAVAGKAFRDEAEKVGLPIEYVSGEETTEVIAGFYKMSPKVIAKAREIMGRK
ncbi:MAG: Bug family tripartite tricarboxylate transporter substrate binding protein [Xanthobacteraceae bacterium]